MKQVNVFEFIGSFVGRYTSEAKEKLAAIKNEDQELFEEKLKALKEEYLEVFKREYRATNIVKNERYNDADLDKYGRIWVDTLFEQE